MLPYTTETDALRAARAIWRGAGTDLIYHHPSGGFKFDIDELRALKEIHEDTMTENTEITTEAAAPEKTLTKRERQRLERESKAATKAAKKAEDARIRAEKHAQAEKARADARALREAKRFAIRSEALAERAERAAERTAKRDQRRNEAVARAQARAQRSANAAANREAAAAARAKAASERARLREEREAARAETSRNGVCRPATGTKMANLWQLLDGLSGYDEADGESYFPSLAEYREVAAGMPYEVVGAPGTITTAYYEYRTYHGVGKGSQE